MCGRSDAQVYSQVYPTRSAATAAGDLGCQLEAAPRYIEEPPAALRTGGNSMCDEGPCPRIEFNVAPGPRRVHLGRTGTDVSHN
jgi:hypothetical protein